MPSLSRWMIGYGLLLIACDVIDSLGLTHVGLQGRTLISGWAGGLLMTAAGLSAAQGRRSLRLTGIYVGLLLPIALGGIFLWSAIDLLRSSGAPEGPTGPAIALGLLALCSFVVAGVMIRIRPRDGIASRGYAVTISAPRKGE